jgi:hypothetical protein
MTRFAFKVIDLGASAVFMALCVGAFRIHFYKDIERARSSVNSAHGPIHRAGADALQGFLARVSRHDRRDRPPASDRMSVSPLWSEPTTTVRRSSRPSLVQRRTSRNRPRARGRRARSANRPARRVRRRAQARRSKPGALPRACFKNCCARSEAAPLSPTRDE